MHVRLSLYTLLLVYANSVFATPEEIVCFLVPFAELFLFFFTPFGLGDINRYVIRYALTNGLLVRASLSVLGEAKRLARDQILIYEFYF